MTNVKLLGLPASTYMRTAMMALENKGVPYSVETVDFRAPEFERHHPFSKVPVLRHGNVELFETLAIATYIDEAFDGPALQPQNPADKAVMLQWISATSGYFYESFVRHCVIERFVKPMRGLEPDEPLIAAEKPTMAKHLDILTRVLTSNDYLAGTEISLADFFLAPIMFYFAMTPEGQDLLPNHAPIQAWNTRMAATKNYGQVNSVG